MTGIAGPGRRHGGEAGRARLPLRVRARTGELRARLRPPGRPRDDAPAGDRRRRCTSCTHLSQRRDRHVTPSRASVDGSERLRLFCALRLPDDVVEPRRRRGRRASCAAAGSCRPRTCTSRWRSSARRPAGDAAGDRRGARAAAAGGSRTLRLRLRGYRETRSVGMLTFDDEGGRAAALAERLHGALEALGRLPPRGPAVASAPHRAPLPRAAAAAAAAARARRGRAVRRRCFHFPAAPGRGAVYEAVEAVPLGGDEGGSRASSGHRPRADRAQLRQGRRDEDERPGAGLGRRDLDRLAPARPRARHRRAAARPRRRDLRPRVVGQDDARLPRDRRGAAPRRHLRLHRRRARDGPDLRQADRRQHRRAARLAARHRRAGARDHRAARPLRRARRWSRSTRSPR